jgi:hypothetical protein
MIRQYLKDEVKQAFVLDLNTGQLYEEGRRADGVSLGEYSPFTIRLKQLKGQRTDHVTLKDEGDFHQSFFLRIGERSFEIDASDEKKDELLDKYGDAVLGLSEQSLKELRQDVKPYLIEAMRKYLTS